MQALRWGFLFLAIGLGSCNMRRESESGTAKPPAATAAKPTDPAPAYPPFVFTAPEQIDFVPRSGSYTDSVSSGPEIAVDIAQLEAVNLANPSLQDTINAWMWRYIEPQPKGGKPQSREELDRYLKNWAATLREDFSETDEPADTDEEAIPSPPLDESYQVQANYLTPFLVIEVYHQGYMGGAHGFHNTSIVNLDLRTGLPVKLEHLLKPGAAAELARLAEPIFLASERKELGKDFDQRMYNYEPGQFPLARNFAIGKNGLLFLYNEYEIGPYVIGARSFLLPYQKLQPLLLPDSPLQPLLP